MFEPIPLIFPCGARRALSNHLEKGQINSSEILNCEHITYNVNTLKIEYLGPGSL
jgi:hypothetical protein